MELEEIKAKIERALDKLYEFDYFLFEKDLCERCINHRFAMYLEQQNFGREYFVDCEYNRSYLNRTKRVSSEKGNYIDIIVTKRDNNYRNDFLCFEIKKWNNYKKRKKDRENLEILTKGIRFNYKHGFYIILGKIRDKIKIEIYKKGKLIEE